VSSHMPHVVDFNESEMTETIAISYRDINWRHVGANTAAFASWIQPLSELKEKATQ
ncbi:Hcp1 family type VI secretion system effector, partial [Vibrio parahaemolyticus]